MGPRPETRELPLLEVLLITSQAPHGWTAQQGTVGGDGQIHTSADAGKTWRLLVNLNQPELIIDNLLVDSRDSRILYASGQRAQAPGGTGNQRFELRNIGERRHA